MENNYVRIAGQIGAKFIYSHRLFGEEYYMATVDIQRDSGVVDIIPVMLSGKQVSLIKKRQAKWVRVTGCFRSRNVNSHLKLYVFVKSVEFVVEGVYDNFISLDCHVCKAPNFRITPLKKKITDLLVAVNRSFGKTDYIPCIVWWENAVFASKLRIGAHIKITGRIQSREYLKNGETKTAYEMTAYYLERSE